MGGTELLEDELSLLEAWLLTDELLEELAGGGGLLEPLQPDSNRILKSVAVNAER